MESNINSELLSVQARGKKHIPFAVFAVILIHIILFVVLLVAAGCRAKGRAKRDLQNSSPVAQQASLPNPSTNAAAPNTRIESGNVLVSEPPIESRRPSVESAPRAAATAVGRPAASVSQSSKLYVVQPGDTVSKIAQIHGMSVKAIKVQNNLKNDMIRPGQKLRVNSSRAQRSTEA
jgi:LysM repeat protein